MTPEIIAHARAVQREKEKRAAVREAIDRESRRRTRVYEAVTGRRLELVIADWNREAAANGVLDQLEIEVVDTSESYNGPIREYRGLCFLGEIYGYESRIVAIIPEGDKYIFRRPNLRPVIMSVCSEELDRTGLARAVSDLASIMLRPIPGGYGDE